MMQTELKYIRALFEELHRSITFKDTPKWPESAPACDTAIISDDAALMALVASHPNTIRRIAIALERIADATETVSGCVDDDGYALVIVEKEKD